MITTVGQDMVQRHVPVVDPNAVLGGQNDLVFVQESGDWYGSVYRRGVALERHDF